MTGAYYENVSEVLYRKVIFVSDQVNERNRLLLKQGIILTILTQSERSTNNQTCTDVQFNGNKKLVIEINKRLLKRC